MTFYRHLLGRAATACARLQRVHDFNTTSLHLREVTIIEITGLNPGHVFIVNDEKVADYSE
jgi:hypothetical protein